MYDYGSRARHSSECLKTVVEGGSTVTGEYCNAKGVRAINNTALAWSVICCSVHGPVAAWLGKHVGFVYNTWGKQQAHENNDSSICFCLFVSSSIWPIQVQCTQTT